NTCVVVGASHAAAQLAPALRKHGWIGRIVVVGDEPCLPYHRPPLSKTYLSGEKDFHDILIKHEAAYKKADVHFTLGVRAESIDRESRLLRLDNGEDLHYQKLALTVGASPRMIDLPGADKAGVYYLRNLRDVDGIRRHVGSQKKAVIIGGGYIGLETAAALRNAGLQVTVLEALPRVLARVTTEQISAFYTRIHQEEGVDVIVGASVSAIEGGQSVQAVICADGARHDADVVIIGVGVVPNTELAAAAGLEVGNGIVVDEYARTSDHDIVAAGDCTYHYNPIYERHLRLESVQNATDQANVAAATLCGQLEPYCALPWFWSDQYDLKLQIAGLSSGYDSVVVRGSTDHGRSFAAFYFAGPRLLAVDAVNRPQDFMLARRIIAGGQTLDLERLADESVPVKDLVIG
ncbi:MAG: NAD(P)/FAD-dependent oxidoreductase, partial [Parahaliea sp.]